jgi:hypothetical protein
MSTPGPLPPEMEIASLEHELVVLRERYSGMQRKARQAVRLFKYGLAATLATAIAGMVYAGATGNEDALITLFVFTAIGVLSGLMAWLCRDWFGKKGLPDRWDFRFYHLQYPFPNHEEFFSHAIAVREKRLKELKAQP